MPAPNLYLSLLSISYGTTDKCEREQLYIERKLFQGEEDSRCHDFKEEKEKKNSMNFIVNDDECMKDPFAKLKRRIKLLVNYNYLQNRIK